ncbi:hypothetical protein ASPTUDRAFT_60842 [Aspergillus tubingensis CBS 134.48]|uniref:Uncharacterized protein n=1 Tax=Aspergillus tubingensis (strain CBS 134.48) TaxID=767770 RepID=A0A1L9NIL7_ASPTC|nr:hypothetical protein ASPTUDRAFT_60842 [Aspergillus tubingensis CBS 134.48]
MFSVLTEAMLSALDVKLLLSERQSSRFQAQSGRSKAISGFIKIPIHKVMVNRSHNVLYFQILLGTDALPGCIRTDSALAALMKASALTVGCRYVGVYASVGGTFPAMDPDHAQRQGWIWYQRLFVDKTSWCKIYAGACAMDRGNTAFATLGIEFHPTSLDPETAEITKRKGETRGSRLIAQHGVNDALALSHSSALCDTGSCRSTVRRESFGSGVSSAEQGYQAEGSAAEEPGGEEMISGGRRFLCCTNFILCPNPSAYYFSEFTE